MEGQRKSRASEAEIQNLDEQKLSSKFFAIDPELKQFRLSVFYEFLQILTRHIEFEWAWVAVARFGKHPRQLNPRPMLPEIFSFPRGL